MAKRQADVPLVNTQTPKKSKTEDADQFSSEGGVAGKPASHGQQPGDSFMNFSSGSIGGGSVTVHQPMNRPVFRDRVNFVSGVCFMGWRVVV